MKRPSTGNISLNVKRNRDYCFQITMEKLIQFCQSIHRCSSNLLSVYVHQSYKFQQAFQKLAEQRLQKKTLRNIYRMKSDIRPLALKYQRYYKQRIENAIKQTVRFIVQKFPEVKLLSRKFIPSSFTNDQYKQVQSSQDSYQLFQDASNTLASDQSFDLSNTVSQLVFDLQKQKQAQQNPDEFAKNNMQYCHTKMIMLLFRIKVQDSNLVLHYLAQIKKFSQKYLENLNTLRTMNTNLLLNNQIHRYFKNGRWMIQQTLKQRKEDRQKLFKLIQQIQFWLSKLLLSCRHCERSLVTGLQRLENVKGQFEVRKRNMQQIVQSQIAQMRVIRRRLY